MVRSLDTSDIMIVDNPHQDISPSLAPPAQVVFEVISKAMII